jgi:hypothetical protein
MFVGPLAPVGARLFLHRLVGILHLKTILPIMPISCSIRGLNHRWELKECSFVKSNWPHFGHPEHSYKTASFVEELEVPEGSFESAWNLLKSLKEKAEECERTDYYYYQKQLVAKYSYPDAQDVPMKDNLLIPKYITSAAATHRLVLVRLFKDTTQYCLQLGYENVPGQCPCSSTFKPARAELVRERERKYGPEKPIPPDPWRKEYSCERRSREVDSDGDSPPVRLSAAAALGEYLGPGVSVQVGRGGFSSSYEGMVHAFIRLSESSVDVVEKPLKSATFLIKTNEVGDVPSGQSRVFLNLPEPRTVRSVVYRAVVANHRQESQNTSSDRYDSGMAIIPIPGGVVTVGCLIPAYHRHIFRNHTDIATMKPSRTQSAIHRTTSSLRHKARRVLGTVRGRWLQCPGWRACRRKNV